uniref:Uncharacterized protein n=1 Tax=viral metagenome TaxID=1070528 RepID=A0A6C0KBV6_9ZZZZ
MDSKQRLLLNSLLEFYNSNSDRNVGILKTIIEQRSIISLRLLDWLTTNYSKQHNIFYNVHGDLFNLHNEYKNQLKAYSKKLFDPFCRRHRIYLQLGSSNKIENVYHSLSEASGTNVIITTVGQMNFFRWAIKYNVANYTVKNHSSIESDMLLRNSNSTDNGNKTPKRQEISQSPNIAVRNSVSGVIHW